jgi:hypothetical protein
MANLTPQIASTILRKLVLIGAQANDAAKALTVGMEMADAAKSASPIALLDPSEAGQPVNGRMRADTASPQDQLNTRSAQALTQGMALAQELVGHAAAMANLINEVVTGGGGGLKLAGE